MKFPAYSKCVCVLTMILSKLLFPPCVQMEVVGQTVSCPPPLRQVRDSWRITGPKRSTAKKESKEKRESNEESKENLKAKSDDSGEEKNGDDDSQKNGPKKK
ncbi:hypothetical protein ILYODFUR_025580, partial [Ilyodon furcidens]